MYQLRWSKEALNYLRDNRGLVNSLELAFLDLRSESGGIPKDGTVEETDYNLYTWRIHGHVVFLRHIQDSVRVEVIQPAPESEE